MAIPLKYNVRNLLVRRISTAMTVLSIGLVVAVFLCLMALSAGIERTLTASGDPGNVLVLRKSAQVESQSAVTKSDYQIIRYMDGIAQGPGGEALVSPEVLVLLNIQRRGQGGASNVNVRGVGTTSFALRPYVRVVEGRLFRPGFREMVVARNLAGRFENTGVGRQMKFGKGTWTVVGHFDAGGTAFDSEMWCDADELMSEFDRSGYSSVLLRSRDDRAQRSLISLIGADRRMQLEAIDEKAYYEKQMVAGIGIRILATVMALFMGTGACFAAMNTMYAAVSNRTREIGTLRALGFSRGNVLLSFLFESVLLALVGGGIGALLALPVNGLATGSANFMTFTEITYNFRITLPLIVTALALAGALGVLGGFFPARAAARQQIIEALRST
jgi:putative ABC transport system permease protein